MSSRKWYHFQLQGQYCSQQFLDNISELLKDYYITQIKTETSKNASTFVKKKFMIFRRNIKNVDSQLCNIHHFVIVFYNIKTRSFADHHNGTNRLQIKTYITLYLTPLPINGNPGLKFSAKPIGQKAHYLNLSSVRVAFVLKKAKNGKNYHQHQKRSNSQTSFS